MTETMTIDPDEAGFPLLSSPAARRALTPDQAKTVAELEARARRMFGSGFWWPYGPNIRVASRMALLDWAEPLGVRQTTSRRPCLHWLAVGRCLRRDCHGGITVDGKRPRWADHVTAWYVPRTDLRLIVAQPYLPAERAAVLLPEGFHAIVRPSGWYGLDACQIELWSRDPAELTRQERR